MNRFKENIGSRDANKFRHLASISEDDQRRNAVDIKSICSLGRRIHIKHRDDRLISHFCRNAFNNPRSGNEKLRMKW